jgi:hypothetical protein
MRFKRIICMLLMSMLMSSCKITHDLALSKKPTTDEIVLTEVDPTTPTTEHRPTEIAGHPVTWSDDNNTETNTEEPATIDVNKSTNWLLIALIGLPPLLILLVVINKKIAKKLNENG